MGTKREDLGAKLHVAVSDRPSLRCGPVPLLPHPTLNAMVELSLWDLSCKKPKSRPTELRE